MGVSNAYWLQARIRTRELSEEVFAANFHKGKFHKILNHGRKEFPHRDHIGRYACRRGELVSAAVRV